MMAGLVAIALGQDMAVAGGPFGCHPLPFTSDPYTGTMAM
jgi:hypothetical protein